MPEAMKGFEHCNSCLEPRICESIIADTNDQINRQLRRVSADRENTDEAFTEVPRLYEDAVSELHQMNCQLSETAIRTIIVNREI